MSLVHQAQILNGDAGLLQGSRSSVVRASTAKVGGLGFDSQWLIKFFPVSILTYHQVLPTVLTTSCCNQNSYKNNHVCLIVSYCVGG